MSKFVFFTEKMPVIIRQGSRKDIFYNKSVSHTFTRNVSLSRENVLKHVIIASENHFESFYNRS